MPSCTLSRDPGTCQDFSLTVILLLPRTKVDLSATISYDWSPWTSTSFTWVQGVNTQKWIVDGSLDLYCFAAGAIPTKDDFKKNGGYVYVMGTHNGHFYRDSNTPRKFECLDTEGSSTSVYWFVDYIESNVEDYDKKILEPHVQLPTSPASHTGSTYYCKIALSFFTRKTYLLPPSRRLLLQGEFHGI